LDPFPAFLNGGIRQTNYGHSWEAGCVIDLNFYNDPIQPYNCTGKDTRKHALSIDKNDGKVN
jgi:hypothetical protein